MNEQTVTFETTGTVTAGTLVTLAANGTVRSCATAGDVPLGLVVEVRGNYAGVQIQGYMALPCDAAMTVGFCRLVTDANGKAKKGDTGREAFVVDVDSVAGICGLIL